MTHAVTRLFDLVSAALLAAMAAVTFVDVVGRYLFNRPMRGAFELTEVLMAATIFAALPSLTRRREHIAIDILDHYLPARVQRIRDRVIDAASAAVVAFLAWRFFLQARQMNVDGLYTQALQMPLAPVVFFATAALALAALLHLLLTLERR
jgi:TRAP-type C4-dicarboxylate transport system permease small subunit